MQGCLPRGIGWFDQERRAPARLDDPAGKGETAMVELFRQLRICRAKILRGNENALNL